MTQDHTNRDALSDGVCAAMECILLVMIAAAPWMFGSVHPLPELLLVAGLALMLLLWALRLAVSGGPLWAPCGFGVGLALLCMLGIWQITPLPNGMLQAIAPATAQIYDQMLPAVPEQTRDGVAEISQRTSTLSVSPFATKSAVFELIMLLALFALVRSNLTSPNTIYRLAVVVVLNGALLAFVGLGQFFTSPHDVVFWTFTSQGAVFGPFICRNHFAYQMNLSLGLGFGLLLCARDSRSGRNADSSSFVASIQNLLQQPAVLWVASALVLMGVGLVCSLSRGGVVAFLVAAMVCLLVRVWHSKWTIRFRSGIVLAASGLAIIAWLTNDIAGKRLATLWKTNVLDEGRGPVWTRLLDLIPQYPLFGTGLGTFRFVEPLTRRPNDSTTVLHDHAHNDFLEALIEGGVVQLAIVAAMIVLLIVAGIRAHAQLRDRWEGNLVLGSLFGLTAVLVHSVVDFGMHIPAITLLTTVIAALLLNVADSGRSPATPEAQRETSGVRRLLAPATGIIVLLCVAFFLIESAWRSERAERYRLAATRVADEDPERDRKKVAYLEAALAFTPGDPVLLVSAAEAHHERFIAKHDQCWVKLAPQIAGIGSTNGRAGLMGVLSTTALADSALSQDENLTMALQHHLSSRAACPLLPQPQLFLAAYSGILARADRPAKYLERACFLRPSNPKSWYVAGQHALHESDQVLAWECWRRSLLCSPTYLPQILDGVGKSLTTAELLQHVLPEDPSRLFDAAMYVQKSNPPVQNADVILASALVLLERQAPRAGPPLVLKARVEANLRKIPMARKSYELALAGEPTNSALRLEYGEFLIRAGELRHAHNELVTILSLQPDNARAKSIYTALLRDLAEKEN